MAVCLQVTSTPPGVPGFAQTVKAPDSDAIKVTLQDCLACSGCITSAETVLLQHQSTEELLQKLQDPSMTVIATLSPQSRASLAEAYGLTLPEVRTPSTGVRQPSIPVPCRLRHLDLADPNGIDDDRRHALAVQCDRRPLGFPKSL